MSRYTSAIPGLVFPLHERLRARRILSDEVLYWRDLFANLRVHLRAVIGVLGLHARPRQRTLKRALGSTRSTLTSATPTDMATRRGAAGRAWR
jgi:hypothetical protein